MIGPEGVSVATGLAESPTVTFEASEAVAAQIHSGTRTALNAFMDGDLTLTGDVGALSTVAKLLGDNDPFADLARKTTYS